MSGAVRHLRLQHDCLLMHQGRDTMGQKMAFCEQPRVASVNSLSIDAA